MHHCGWHGSVACPLQIDAGWLMYVVLGAATGLKLLCYVLCVALQSKSGTWDSVLQPA
jgi:hypothetical protein